MSSHSWASRRCCWSGGARRRRRPRRRSRSMTLTGPLEPASAGPSPARSLASGPVLFARYAYGPNRFGYCGPDDADELLEAGAAGQDRVLRALAQRFEGAYPYLALIARSAGIADPLDRRVVEAYWLGNDLLRAVPPGSFGA